MLQSPLLTCVVSQWTRIKRQIGKQLKKSHTLDRTHIEWRALLQLEIERLHSSMLEKLQSNTVEKCHENAGEYICILMVAVKRYVSNGLLL